MKLLLFIIIGFTLSLKSELIKNQIVVDISEQRLYLIKKDTKIGSKAPLNTLFVGRVNTNRTAKIISTLNDSDDDYVTSRILWLDGLEEGINKGKGVDSFNRYIYIHGTHEEGLIGTKASHGCIRMFNNDVIKLYNLINKGTKVYIQT